MADSSGRTTFNSQSHNSEVYGDHIHFQILILDMLVSHLSGSPLVAHQANSAPKGHHWTNQKSLLEPPTQCDEDPYFLWSSSRSFSYKSKGRTWETALTNPSSKMLTNIITHHLCRWQMCSLPEQAAHHCKHQNDPQHQSQTPIENTTQTIVQGSKEVTVKTQPAWQHRHTTVCVVSVTPGDCRATNNPISNQVSASLQGLNSPPTLDKVHFPLGNGREHPEVFRALGKPSAPTAYPPQSPQQWP